MAERGGDRPDDNPFSFKAFINGKEKKPIERDIFSDDEEDVFDTVPVLVSNDSVSTRHLPTENLNLVPDVPDLDASLPDDKPKDNPFSFKKFLSSGSASTTTTKPSATLSPYQPPDVASDVPSFRNDYFEDMCAPSMPVKPTESLVNGTSTKTKPDSFSKKKKQSISSKNRIDDSSRNTPKHKSAQLPLFDNFNDASDHDDFESRDTHPVGLQLPDFLSDGPLLGGKPTMPINQNDRQDIDEDLMNQIHTLQEENRRLRDDLSKMKQKYDDKSQRITQLKSDFERQKKKEAEETAVMEKAVLQVEENLVTTTKRAVQAESAVLKLKQEVTGLQNQVQCLTTENEAFQSGDEGLAAIRERTKYTSEQLSIGAQSAEKSLKDLLLGVEKMKLLSQVLSSLEKVSEVKPDADESKS